MRILIVEDDHRMADLLRRGLEREGYAVLLATDGQAAVDIALNVDHDMMILDWMLPKLDGHQVASRLREARLTTPILMLTARDAPPDVVRGLDCGADDYLTKPFAFEVLLARLRALARRVPAPRLPVLQVADLTLDPSTRRVARATCEIKLSNREFALLQFLMRRVGQVVPREVLLAAVWGYDSRIESNTLDAFIHLLRSKIDAAPNPKLIHTVRGVGYSIGEGAPR